MTATLAYQHGGAPAATASASTTPTVPPVLPTQPVVNFSTVDGSKDCAIRMTAVFPSIQDGAKPHLYIATATFGYDIWLSNVQSNVPVSLDFPVMNPGAFANGSVPGIDHYTVWGDVPTCDGTSWIANADVNDAFGTLVGTNTYVYPSLPPAQCAPGTFSNTGAEPCIPALPGSYVDTFAATDASPCGLGFYSDLAGATYCTPAPKGTYIGSTGAISATACPTGQTTALLAARSIYECYTQAKQSARGVRVLTVYKSGLKFTTVKTTDLGAPFDLTATGACTVSSVKVVNKLNGKKVKVDRYQVALGKSGNCTLTYVNAGTDKYKAITVVKKFKITKTGK